MIAVLVKIFFLVNLPVVVQVEGNNGQTFVRFQGSRIVGEIQIVESQTIGVASDSFGQPGVPIDGHSLQVFLVAPEGGPGLGCPQASERM